MEAHSCQCDENVNDFVAKENEKPSQNDNSVLQTNETLSQHYMSCHIIDNDLPMWKNGSEVHSSPGGKRDYIQKSKTHRTVKAFQFVASSFKRAILC